MAFDLQEFINQTLVEEGNISDRQLKIKDLLSLTNFKLNKQSDGWFLFSGKVTDLELIQRLSDHILTETPSDPIYLDNVVALATKYAEKMTAMYRDFVIQPISVYPYQDRELTSLNAKAVYGLDKLPIPEKFSNLSRNILEEDDFYKMVEVLELIFGGAGFTSLYFSGAFVASLIETVAISSDAYEANQFDYKTGVDVEQTIMDQVSLFYNDSSISLKNLQENVFFELFEEVVVV